MAVREVTVGGNAEPIGIAEARSALAWWLEAGVDVAVQEEPRDWLRPAPARPSPLADPIPAPNLTEPSPETLAELRDWLSSSAQLPLAHQRNYLAHARQQRGILLQREDNTVLGPHSKQRAVKRNIAPDQCRQWPRPLGQRRLRHRRRRRHLRRHGPGLY